MSSLTIPTGAAVLSTASASARPSGRAAAPAVFGRGASRSAGASLPTSVHAVRIGKLSASAPPARRAARLAVHADGGSSSSSPIKTKVVVLGGNGFVGSRVCKALQAKGCLVTSVSRSGLPPTWAEGEDWVSGVDWVSADVLSDDLGEILTGTNSVVSCIGTIGGSDKDMATGNGTSNKVAITKAQEAGVPKFVYISVASIVGEVVGQFVMKGYFEGKKLAEDTLADDFPGAFVVVRPSFIYGGEDFGLTPPRVAESYGSLVESLLSSGPMRGLAERAPGPIALTLAPPVSVEKVAAAAAAAALGAVPAGSVIDGTDAINEAALSL